MQVLSSLAGLLVERKTSCEVASKEVRPRRDTAGKELYPNQHTILQTEKQEQYMCRGSHSMDNVLLLFSCQSLASLLKVHVKYPQWAPNKM
eukprot:1170727-Amphidinium_carterae.1